MFQYLPFEERLQSDEGGIYISYGIKITDISGYTILLVSDVSLDKQLVCNLCYKCKVAQLDPIHLHDVIEDNI